jgi:hypothetical protein
VAHTCIPLNVSKKSPVAKASPAEGVEAGVSTALGARLTPRVFAAILGLLIFVTYPDAIIGDGTFVLKDYAVFGYSLAHHHKVSFGEGTLPLWNPLNDCGLPFLAQWNTLTLYPGSLIYLLFPLSWSLGIFCLLHQFAGGLGMYFLARRWTGNNLAGAVAGLAFAFNGLTQHCLMWPNNIAALGCLPWVWLLARRGWLEGGRWLAAAGLMGAMQMLTGAPEIILLSWAMLSGFALLDLFATRQPAAMDGVSVKVMSLRFGGIVGLISLIASPQLLPFIDMLAHSPRVATEDIVDWPIPLHGWANYLVPLFHTQTNAIGAWKQIGQGWTHSYYAGVGILWLAFIAMCRERNAMTIFMMIAFVVSLLLGMGDNTPVYTAVSKVIPLGFMRFPVKFIVVATMVLPLLAAYGVRGLQRPKQELQDVFISALLIVGLIMTVYWMIGARPDELAHPSETYANAEARLLLFALFGAVLICLSHASMERMRPWLAIGLLVVLWFDLKNHQPFLAPTMTRNNYLVPNPTVRKLTPAVREGRERVLLLGVTQLQNTFRSTSTLEDNFIQNRLDLYSNLNLLEGVAKIDGFFSMWFPEKKEVESLLYRLGTTNVMPGLADFLAIRQTTSPTEFMEWQLRPSAHPMVTAGQTPVFLGPTNTIERMSQPAWDSSQEVFLRPEVRARVKSAASADAKVSDVQLSAHEIRFKVSSTNEALAVIAQNFYHPWKASVGGKPVELLRANHAFQAVAVPAGEHEVILRYVDHKFRLGLGLSVFGLMMCGWLWRVGRKVDASGSGQACE